MKKKTMARLLEIPVSQDNESSSATVTVSTLSTVSSPRVNYADQIGRNVIDDDDDDDDDDNHGTMRTFPAALLLRLRVTQIVCGILVTLLGTVACIEEMGGFRVGVGVLAGFACIIAASANIHISRHVITEAIGWSIILPLPPSHWRAGAIINALWLAATATNIALIIQVIFYTHLSNSNLIILGSFEVSLTIVILGIAGATVWICHRYDSYKSPLPP